MDKVILTESAVNDLHEIAYFIAKDSGSLETALRYIEKLESGILSLNQYPERGAIPRYRMLKLQGFRFLTMENHLVFYKVNGNQREVTIYRVIHFRSEYKQFL